MATTKRSPRRIVTTTPTTLHSTHFAGLDGLRAVAVAAVLAYHVAPGALPGGGIGVDIFFVISGFLITGLLISEHEREGRIALGHFWARRARRLVPALAAVVLVCSSLALFVGGDVLVGIGRQVLGAATFSSNWLAIANGPSYFTGTTPEIFQNLWSLAVEEQFYLVWPFVVILALVLPRRRWRVALFAALAIASALAMAVLYPPDADATRVYYGTDTHSFGLAIGAVLAVVTRTMRGTRLEWPLRQRQLLPIPGVIAFLALLAATALLPANAAITFHGGLAAVAIATAITIWGAIIPGSLLGRALDLPPVRWLGVRSYGIYLWHWPVLELLQGAFPRLQDAPGTAWLIGSLTVILSVTAAALSYRFIETPIRQRGFRAVALGAVRSGARRAPRLIGGIAIVAIILTVGSATGLAITHAPATGHAQADIKAGQVAISAAHLLPPPPPGAPGTKMDAVGDSVMLAAAPALQRTFPGIAIDAVVSRQMNTLPTIVANLIASGQLRETLVVGLGTNGPISAETLEQVHRMLGPDRAIVIVNVQAPRGWTPSVNQTLAAFDAEYDNVELADWHDAIAPYISILAPDHIHPGPTGGRIYAQTVQNAVTRLAARPTYPTMTDFLVPAPRPTPVPR